MNPKSISAIYQRATGQSLREQDIALVSKFANVLRAEIEKDIKASSASLAAPAVANAAPVGQIETELKLIEEIAKWAGDSCQMRQISQEEFDYASEFDMRMAQASQELTSAVGAIRICLDLAAAGAPTSGGMMTDWIACSDRLPELADDSVLAYFPANGGIDLAHIMDYFGDITAGVDAEGTQLYTKWYLRQGVTHWMRLPPPPEA